MYQFKSADSVSKRVNAVIKSTIETRGESWLLGLGYMECNDFAQLVVDQVSYTSGYKEHIRFETVARYVRQHKSAIRTRNALSK